MLQSVFDYAGVPCWDKTICTHTCTVQVLYIYSESLFFILDESWCESGSGESESSENENGTSLTIEGL